MDKIEFEELALRRVDLALGSNLWWGGREGEGGLGNEFGGEFRFVSFPTPTQCSLVQGPTALPTVTDVRVRCSRPSTAAR